MKKILKIYNNKSSSFFNLIEGDKETQQTKGLALVFSKSDLALNLFFSLDKVVSKVGLIDWPQINQVIINAELISNSTNKYRADLMIRMYSQNKPYKLVIIEAKSANKNIPAKAAANQLEKYKDGKAFKEFEEFDADRIYGVTLTKYHEYLKQDWIAAISWDELFNKFYYADRSNEDILDDYFTFITSINGTMKFYEKEVFSIPTVDWSSTAINQLQVYECPNSGKYLIKNKPLFLTFRATGGGEMEKLYKIEEVIILNFSEELASFLEDENYSEATRNRVRKYAHFMQERGIWVELPNDEKQVFILSDKTIILPHKPKPKRNNSFRAYYELAELLDHSKEFVNPDK